MAFIFLAWGSVKRMKVGDLIKVADCPAPESSFYECGCFFCAHSSNRMGIIKKIQQSETSDAKAYTAQFDIGEWIVFEEEIALISEVK